MGAPLPERRLSLQVSVESTERLDRFLADQLSLSRTQAARLIARGAVRINDQRGRASRHLARGDQIDVLLATDQSPEPRQLRPHCVELDVVHEDEWLLILDKPAGLVVHPAPGHWDDTLLNALARRGTRLSGGSGRPGIVHRLDKDTSGLMVLAKADRTHARLTKLLSQRKIERVYAALVWGHLGGAREIDAAVTVTASASSPSCTMFGAAAPAGSPPVRSETSYQSSGLWAKVTPLARALRTCCS